MYRRVALLALAGLILAGCGSRPVTPVEDPDVEPATVEAVAGQDGIHRITLTPEAAVRLGIEVAEVVDGGGGRTRVPYSALIYDAEGAAWTYMVDGSEHVFIRHAVTVHEIVADSAGDYVVLSSGPPSGAAVASVGVAELFGAEFEVGH